MPYLIIESLKRKENELPLSFIKLKSWLDKELDKEKVLYTNILYV